MTSEGDEPSPNLVLEVGGETFAVGPLHADPEKCQAAAAGLRDKFKKAREENNPLVVTTRSELDQQLQTCASQFYNFAARWYCRWGGVFMAGAFGLGAITQAVACRVGLVDCYAPCLQGL